MPRVRLIALVVCCAFCFGGSLAIDQASTDQSPSALPAASLTSATDSLDTRLGSSPITRKQLLELKRSINRVREDMRSIESGLQDASLSRDQLIGLQRKATKRLQLLDRRVSKYLRLTANLEKTEVIQTGQRTEHSPNDLDQVDQQLSSTNKIKVMQEPKFFFSSSSSSSSVSPPNFWHVDASASTIRPHSSSNGFGSSSFSSSTQSSNQLSSGSVSSDSVSSNLLPSNSPPSNASSSFSTNSPDLHPSRSNTNNSFNNSLEIVTDPEISDSSVSKKSNVKDRLSDIGNNKSEKLGETLDKVRTKSKIDRFTGDLIEALKDLIHSSNGSTNQVTQQVTNARREKHPFLLYHKCSEGYLQLTGEGSLSTGMDPNLLAKSEFILHYLTKPHNNQLQIQTQDDRFLCFNAQGRPEIMVSWLFLLLNLWSLLQVRHQLCQCHLKSETFFIDKAMTSSKEFWILIFATG